MSIQSQNPNLWSPCFHGFVLKLTSFNKVNGKVFGSRVHALQLQVAPGEQAALDRPEQGEEHRADLPLGPIEHQQLTLQGGDKEKVFTTRPFTEHSRGHFFKLVCCHWQKEFQGNGEQSPKLFQPRSNQGRQYYETSSFAVRFSEPLQMVFTP